jgi:hypothetical protein
MPGSELLYCVRGVGFALFVRCKVRQQLRKAAGGCLPSVAKASAEQSERTPLRGGCSTLPSYGKVRLAAFVVGSVKNYTLKRLTNRRY